MSEDRTTFLRTTLRQFPLPARVLGTMVIFSMAVAMAGALGQVVVHDVIPTMRELGIISRSGDESSADTEMTSGHSAGGEAAQSRGDLLGENPASEVRPDPEPFYKSEQFVWTLKWTHIHLFGMNMIFIFMGAVTLFLNHSGRVRAWLIGLPFIGVLLDISVMWLKGFISPLFFWLHLPGGGLFAAVFTYVSIKALWEMWGPGQPAG